MPESEPSDMWVHKFFIKTYVLGMEMMCLGENPQHIFLWRNKIKVPQNYHQISLNPGPAEPGYVLPLQTVQIQISWLLKKPTDLDLHSLPLSM